MGMYLRRINTQTKMKKEGLIEKIRESHPMSYINQQSR
ncbi:hypothetical protein C5S32_04750 [ANME-1 cluster archaeon GoMg1]|nr:hypothetical protein [ANME-1 cluster archaeon GoMg1]